MDDIVEEVVREISRRDNNAFLKFRKNIKNRKEVTKENFSVLIKMLESDPIEVMSSGEFSEGEMHLVSRALKRAKISDPDALVDYLVEDNTKKAPVVLQALLSKGHRISASGLGKYIDEMIDRRMYLCHYKILLTIVKKYKHLVSPKILSFCKTSEHAIAKVICQEMMKNEGDDSIVAEDNL